MATFESWAAELAKVKNQIAELNDKLLNKSLTAGERSTTRRELGEIRDHYRQIRQLASEEDGTFQSGKIRLAEMR